MASPDRYEGLSEGIARAADRTTLAILRELAEAASQMAEDPSIAASPRRLRQIEERLRREAERLIDEFGDEAIRFASDDLVRAYLEGIKEGQAQAAVGVAASAVVAMQVFAPRAGGPTMRLPDAVAQKLPASHRGFYAAFYSAAVDDLQGAVAPITRVSHDMLRRIATEIGLADLQDTETYTRRQFSQRIMNRIADTGLQTVTYRDGRNMSLYGYSEMTARTMTNHAAQQATINAAAERGRDLVRMSAHSRPSPWCEPWQGRILSTSGASDTYPALQEALSDGAFHPNCRHSLSVYHPGVSFDDIEERAHPAEKALWDEHGKSRGQEIAYEASQKQRYIERQLRAWKRRDAVDITGDGKAAAKVREWQARMREHIREHPFLPRKYEREQV